MSCIDCNDGNIPGQTGADGVSSYLYIGWADDDTGSNFSIEQDGRCYFSFFVSEDYIVPEDLVLGDFTGGWTNVCCPDCPPVVETDLTVNDTVSITLSASGTANHTLEAAVNISAVSGNILIEESDGLYVPDYDAIPSVIDYLTAALPDFTYDSGTDTFNLIEANIVTILEDNLQTSIDALVLFQDMTWNGSQYVITTIDAELVQDAMGSAITFATYDDGAGQFNFVPGLTGQVWTTSGGIAQWLPNLAEIRTSATVVIDHIVDPSFEAVIFVNTGGTNITVTLPDAALWLDKEISVKLIDDTNDLTFDTNGGNVEGVATVTFPGAGGLLGWTFKSNGTDWWAISYYA